MNNATRSLVLALLALTACGPGGVDGGLSTYDSTDSGDGDGDGDGDGLSGAVPLPGDAGDTSSAPTDLPQEQCISVASSPDVCQELSSACLGGMCSACSFGTWGCGCKAGLACGEDLACGKDSRCWVE